MAGTSIRHRPAAVVARWIVTAAVIVLCLWAAGEAVACPNCKDAVNTSDPEGLNLARGYFYSILLMLAMPATLVGSFSIYVWREVQRQKREGTSPAEPAGGQAPALTVSVPTQQP